MIPNYVDDIRGSLKNKCYFSALSLALTMPDICGMAEFPNKQVGERYIEWYDKYIGDYMAYGKDDLGGDNPWLSGEVVYNLRNTFLHQGYPGIDSDKVKEEANRLDKFILMLGDGTDLQVATINIEAGTKEAGKITYRMITVNVTYLCDSICDCVLWYYKNNQKKFKFDFNVVTQEEWRHPSEEELQFANGDVFAKILNHKLEKENSKRRFVEDPDRKPLARMSQFLKVLFSDKAMKQRFLNGESIFTFMHPFKPHSPILVEESKNDVNDEPQVKPKSQKKNTDAISGKKKKQSSKNVSREKHDAQVRSFFGSHFKEKMYLNRKEEIIQAVLKAKTKQQVNNNLMKHFKNNEVSTIYQRLRPLIKDLPGK